MSNLGKLSLTLLGASLLAQACSPAPAPTPTASATPTAAVPTATATITPTSTPVPSPTATIGPTPTLQPMPKDILSLFAADRGVDVNGGQIIDKQTGKVILQHNGDGTLQLDFPSGTDDVEVALSVEDARRGTSGNIEVAGWSLDPASHRWQVIIPQFPVRTVDPKRAFPNFTTADISRGSWLAWREAVFALTAENARYDTVIKPLGWQFAQFMNVTPNKLVIPTGDFMYAGRNSKYYPVQPALELAYVTDFSYDNKPAAMLLVPIDLINPDGSVAHTSVINSPDFLGDAYTRSIAQGLLSGKGYKDKLFDTSGRVFALYTYNDLSTVDVKTDPQGYKRQAIANSFAPGLRDEIVNEAISTGIFPERIGLVVFGWNLSSWDCGPEGCN